MLKLTSIIFVQMILIIAIPAAGDQQLSVVTPEWVAAHANDADVRILDVRLSPMEYLTGHVPNAVNMADNTIRGPEGGVPAQYLPPEMMAQVLSRAGVTGDSRVVVYSDGENVLGATMVAYVLERMGHPNVMLMDGGWSVYKTSQPTSQKYPSYKAGTLQVKPNRQIYVTLDEIKSSIGKPGIVIIDARPGHAYKGESKIWMRNGHIPGAINIDWHDLTDPNNNHKLKTTQEMQKIFDTKGVDKGDDIIVYCGTSREATLEYAALKHLLGYSKVRLYEGSWTEYCSHPELEMKTGNQ